VSLPKGSTIWMRYHYDNSADNPRNPNHPPRHVGAGNETTDEMAHLWLQVLPRGERDRRRELQEAALRHRLEKYPDDYNANLNLGALLLARLDAANAEAALQKAVRAEPERANARNMLGVALNALGRLREEAQFRIAIDLDPALVSARFNLANALAR